MQDRAPRPGDDDLVAIACRRTTFEWTLRRLVLDLHGVTVSHGVAVDHLIATTTDNGRPQVTGVVTNDGTTIDADLVVAALGRRSAVARWSTDLGVELDVEEEDTGIVYLSRFYRLHADADLPETNGPIGGDIGYLKYGVFLGDNRTYSVTLAVRTGDDELRSMLLDPATFDRAARTLPATATWAEADRAEAITPVEVMGGLVNRRTRFTDDAGDPYLLGLHAVGDAHTCTNPLYGRGCSLAMVQAHLLAQALRVRPDDALARGREYEAACDREILPWYRASVHQDRINREQAAREKAIAAGTIEADDTNTDPAQFAQDVLREGLMPAVRTDPDVFRAFIRTFNLLTTPDAMLTDSDVFGRVLAAYQDRENRPPEPVLGPPRQEMLAALLGVALQERCSRCEGGAGAAPQSGRGSAKPGSPTANQSRKRSEPAAVAAGRIAPLGNRRSRSAPMIDDGRGSNDGNRPCDPRNESFDPVGPEGQPPATACMIESVPPSGTGVSRPCRKRTSSSSTNRFT